jgi:hypothetical protein
MGREPTVWQMALGTMVGNIGCFAGCLLSTCVLMALLSVMGMSLGSILKSVSGLGP